MLALFNKVFTETMMQGPHTLQLPKERPGIMPNVLHAIGNTPLVRINRIAQSAGLKCEMCKYNNKFKETGYDEIFQWRNASSSMREGR